MKAKISNIAKNKKIMTKHTLVPRQRQSCVEQPGISAILVIFNISSEIIRHLALKLNDALLHRVEDFSSRSEPFRVPGKHAGLPDIVQPQVQHGHPLHAYSTTSMRRTPISEIVNI